MSSATKRDDSPDPRELAYYKRRLDELAGETLRLDYEVSGLRKEVNQKRQAFTLLSRLQQTIGAEKDISNIFALVLEEVNATLGMDRTVVLTPSEGEDEYRPTQWTGFTEEGRVEELERRMSEAVLHFRSELVEGRAPLLVNKKSERTPLVEKIRETFELPFFVCAPVIVEGVPIGLLLSGRIKEAGSVFPPLDQGDVETFQALAGLISRSVENMRIGVLREMDRLKTEFFANISHEFRTPITLTLGPLEGILSGRYGEISAKVREQAHVMQRNQERLLGLVHQILSLAKLEAGRVRLRAAPLPDVNAFIEERLEPFRSAAEGRGIALTTSFDPRARQSRELFVDRQKLDELLSNLLSNALKFTTEGSIDVGTELHDGRFRLKVKDTGVGIPADELPHIFDRFRQADGSVAREYGGTGIGLAWVKEIAELHGGVVTARSDYGHGSTFTVDLPLGTSHLDPSSVVEYEEQDLPSLGRGSRAYVVSEGAHGRESVDALNREGERALDPTRPTVVYAEDNADLRRFLKDLLSEHYNVFLATDGRDGLDKVRRYAPDLVIVDQMMPRMSGVELLSELRRQPELRSLPVIFLTARAGTEARIESLEAGADDYVTKPFEFAELLARMKNLLQIREQERELTALNRELEARIEDQMAALVRKGEVKRFLSQAVVESLVSRSPRMQEVLDLCWKIAESSSTVLIRGETGTGKEVVARTIHLRSACRDGPFVPVHCAALPASLLESELFGHEKGAFTGATTRRQGRFELAHGGTLFLDEVGEIGPEVQVKLLRVLQERQFERIGGNETIRVKVRMIAATNRDLEREVREGRFREDLYYRLNVVPITLPPLRERPEDIPLLATHFLERYRRQLGRSALSISASVQDSLCAYAWPGNVREIQNLMERMVVTVEGDTIQTHHLPPELRSGSYPVAKEPSVGGERLKQLEEQERRHIRQALVEAHGVIRGDRGAAALLGIPESTLRYRMKKLGIRRTARRGKPPHSSSSGTVPR